MHSTNGFVLPFVVALAATPASAAAQFDVLFEGASPAGVRVSTGDASFPLVPATGGFKGSVNATSPDFTTTDLDADYSDQSNISVPLQLRESDGKVLLWLVRPSSLSCLKPTIDGLERQLKSDLRTRMATYIEAKAIYNLQTDDACGSAMRPLAAKAWFDASFALARDPVGYFRLDPAAEDALNTYDSKYVQKYREEIDAFRIKLLNDQKQAQLKAKNYRAAAATNDLIVHKLSADDELAGFALTKQGISETLLKNDGAYIATMSGANS